MSRNTHSMHALFSRMILIALLAITIVEGIIHFTLFGEFDYTDLEDVSATVTLSDGTRESFPANALPPLDAGDSVDFVIRLPKNTANDYTAKSLAFYQYHSTITVTGYDGIPLFSFGQEEWQQGRTLGDDFVYFTLPARYYGNSITVHVEQKEAYGSSHITDFRLLNSENARLYPMIHNQLYFLLYGTIIILSIFTFVTSIVTQLTRREFAPATAMLSLFCFLISVWQLSYRRMFYVLVNNQLVASTTEFWALMLAPVPLFFFIAELKDRPIARWLYRSISIALIIYDVISLSLNYVQNVHIVNRENFMYGFMIVALILTLIIEFVIDPHEKNQSTKIYRRGLLISAIMILIQIFAIALRTFFPTNLVLIYIQRFDFSAFAVLIFMAAMSASIFARFQHSIEKQAREEQTEFLAYHDLLTGLYNRTYCEEQLDDLDRHPEMSYAIFFFDSDNLKKANDNYGHKTGDALIKETARNIKSAVPHDDGSFVCRWGGDEFLMVLKNVDHIDHVESKLKKAFAATNTAGIFPFFYSVSYGYAVHQSKMNLSTSEIRQLADSRMYINKKKNKAERL